MRKAPNPETSEADAGTIDAEAAGWEAIAELTGGIPPEQIDALRSVRQLESVYPLLHAVVGRSVRDFFVRAAALEALVAAGRASFSQGDLAEALYWLDEEARDAVVRSLRHAGWLDYEPSIGTAITGAGRWAYDVLSFLHKRLQESELLPTVAGVSYALDIGVDPVHHLQSMRSRLVALAHEIESARASYSEIVLRRAAKRIEDALALSGQIRAVLDRVPLDHRAARRVVREIHDLLSRLHGGNADLHRAITEIGRQYLQLTAGLTIEQVIRALMRVPVDVLAGTGHDGVLPALRPPPFLTPEAAAHAAEVHVSRERGAEEGPVWEEPAEAERRPEAFGIPSEVVSWVADLVAISEAGEAMQFSDVIPRGTTSESLLRASLLPLAGDGRGGEGVAGQLGAVPVVAVTEGEGWPKVLLGGPLRRLSPGWIEPRSRRR